MNIFFNYLPTFTGLGLACLHMTVLGFENVTYGFILKQCVSEFVLGVVVGVSAIVGVLASIAFPFLRKLLNLGRTGLMGMYILVACLTLCLASIWMDGSPFDANYFLTNATQSNIVEKQCESSSYLSVTVFLVGLIAGRFGLWVSDLTITQILQENVKEEHRGVIGGVQDSLNSAMNTIKFVLVIVLPQIETFGWLIMASFSFVCTGTVFYTTYAVYYRRVDELSSTRDTEFSSTGSTELSSTRGTELSSTTEL